MKTIINIVALWFLCVGSVLAGGNPVETTVYMYKEDKGHTYSCSGTIVGINLILTAKHCDKAAGNVIHNGKKTPVLKLEPVEGIDAMFIIARIDCPCATNDPVVRFDRPAQIVGYPKGKYNFWTGMISYLVPAHYAFKDEKGIYLVTDTTPIPPGTSGGGLWQMDGNDWILIGVAVAASEETGRGLSVPIYEILERR